MNTPAIDRQTLYGPDDTPPAGTPAKPAGTPKAQPTTPPPGTNGAAAVRAADLMAELAAQRETLAQTLAQLAAIRSDIAAIRADLAAIRAAPVTTTQTPSAAQSPSNTPHTAAPGTVTRDIIATAIRVGTDDRTGNLTYKAIGIPFNRFGVRIWPEVLSALGINPDALRPGDNPITPASVRVLLNDKGQARKVTGPAPALQAPDDPDDF